MIKKTRDSLRELFCYRTWIYKLDSTELFWYGVVVLAALILLGTAYGLYWDYQHPCIRSEKYACTNTYCAAFTQISCGTNCQVDTCSYWVTENTTCTRCLERKSREELTTEELEGLKTDP